MAVCVGGRRRRRASASRRRRWASASPRSPWPRASACSRASRRVGRRVLRDAQRHRARRRRAPAQLRAMARIFLGDGLKRGSSSRARGRAGESTTPLNFGIARPALEHARPVLRAEVRLSSNRRLESEIQRSGGRPCDHRRDARATTPTHRARRGPARGGGRALAHLDAHPLRSPGLAWRSLVQTAAAATVAYLVATEVVGHTQPFFAPVAAIITLGHHRRPARGAARSSSRSAWRSGSRSPTGSCCCIGPGAGAAGARGAARDGRRRVPRHAARSSPPRPRSPPSWWPCCSRRASGFSGARFVDALIGGGHRAARQLRCCCPPTR